MSDVAARARLATNARTAPVSAGASAAAIAQMSDSLMLRDA